MSKIIKKYEQGKHTFYNHLLSFLISIAGYPIALNFFDVMKNKNKTMPSIPRSSAAGFLGMPNITNQKINFYPHDVFESIYKNIWPIEFGLEFISPLPEEKPLPDEVRLNAKNTFTLEILSGAFINYFESIKPSIKAKYGVQTRWPKPLYFAKTIRNSFAHGNKVDIRKYNDLAEWKGIKLTQSNNEDQVLFKIIGIVEIIVLMEDMNSLL